MRSRQHAMVERAATPSRQAPSAARRRVLVTGAKAGIGRALALTFARANDRVVATVRSEERARVLTEATCKEALPLDYRPLELTSASSVHRLASALVDEGGIDLLINNASWGVFGAVEDVAPALLLRQLEVNLLGPLLLTRLLLPSLRERRGRIFWIGSLAGRFALPFQAQYSASKAAVASISDALRMELRAFGVQVCCVEPADFATHFTRARTLCIEHDSPYAQTAQRCLAAVEHSETRAPTPERLARLIEKTSRRRRMPARLPAGRLARAISLSGDLLPHSLREHVLRVLYRV